jgi:hypothetical protein
MTEADKGRPDVPLRRVVARPCQCDGQPARNDSWRAVRDKTTETSAPEFDVYLERPVCLMNVTRS